MNEPKLKTQLLNSLIRNAYRGTFSPTIPRKKPVYPVPMTPAVPTRQYRLKWNPPTDPVPVVYRFFEDPDHADAFTKGSVWVSTLERCRQYEDPLQGDPGEGTMSYASGKVQESGLISPGMLERVRRTGGIINIDPSCSDVSLDVQVETKIPDALVLCTTLAFDPAMLSDTFGKYCVEILNPTDFYLTLSHALGIRYAITELKSGPVHYRERRYEGLDASPGHYGFVKPPDKYRHQKEFRMLWKVDATAELTPGVIHVPELAQYCRRIA